MNQGFEVKIVFGKGKKAKTIRLAEDEKPVKENFFEVVKNSPFHKTFKPSKFIKNATYKELVAAMYKDKYGI
jgi:hypothetical protein